MKLNYIFVLGLFFLVNSACYAGGIPCTGNTSPQITLTPSCNGAPISAHVGETLTIAGQVSDLDIGDIVSLSAIGLPAGAITFPSLPSQGNPINLTFTWTPTPANVGAPVTLTFLATDLCGATTTCVFLINVTCLDITLTCPASISTTAGVAGGACGAIVSYSVNASSVSGIDDLTVTPASGSTFPLGKSTVLATATDVCGNTATCSFDVIVDAAPPPTVSCPGNITVAPTSASGAVVTYIASASSAIGITNFNAVPPSGSTFPHGETNVVATATDVCGNTSTCGFTVTVGCVSPPTITCPANITQSAVSCSGTFVNYSPPITTGASLITSPASGSPFPIGTTTVNATATDVCGNTATCSFTVTVAADPPDIYCPSNITVPASTGQCSARVNYLVDAESDIDIDDVVVTPPSGSLFPHGTTTVHATASDVCGNTATCSFTVTVTSTLAVDAGPDVSTVFGYASTQTAVITAIPSGGNAPYSYSWTLNRALKCNQVNTSGDESFTGGTCGNNVCPGSGSSTPAAPICSTSASISVTLISDAVAYITITDANGCTAIDSVNIFAVDGRCFTGNAGKKKTKVCHHTNSRTNPWIQICIDKTAVTKHLAHNPDDYVGPCSGSKFAMTEEEELFMLFPNPVSSALTMEFGTAAKREIHILNAIGTLLYKTSTDVNVLNIDVSNLPSGVYFISARDEDDLLVVKRFVKY